MQHAAQRAARVVRLARAELPRVASGGSVLSRALHATAPTETSLLVGSLSLAAAAVAGSYALRAYNAVNSPEGAIGGGAGGDASAGGGAGGASHKSWGAEALARRFYRGPFEEKMTRREAALVLGVRESATPERIRERYKKMLLLNHPDMGGSTYLAGKVNEAKDILLGRTKT